MRTKQMTQSVRPSASASAATLAIALDRQMLASWAVTAAAVILVMLFHAARGFAQDTGQKTFSSADAAAQALAAAARAQDEPGLEAILGTSRDTIDGGDAAASKQAREMFIQRYDQMHRLVQEPDGSTVLYIGAENWPFPFPLARKGDVWYFDAEAGLDELLYRIVGENEMTAIAICEQLTSAARAAAEASAGNSVASGTAGDADKDDKMRDHARRVRALAQNAKGRTPRPRPDAFYGYYFEVIDPAAADAKSGQAFAFVAYPVDYRTSGVMTFAVTQDGVVYERDLGPETPSLARSIKPQVRRTGWSRSGGKTGTGSAAMKKPVR